MSGSLKSQAEPSYTWQSSRTSEMLLFRFIPGGISFVIFSFVSPCVRHFSRSPLPNRASLFGACLSLPVHMQRRRRRRFSPSGNRLCPLYDGHALSDAPRHTHIKYLSFSQSCQIYHRTPLLVLGSCRQVRFRSSRAFFVLQAASCSAESETYPRVTVLAVLYGQISISICGIR